MAVAGQFAIILTDAAHASGDPQLIRDCCQAHVAGLMDEDGTRDLKGLALTVFDTEPNETPQARYCAFGADSSTVIVDLCEWQEMGPLDDGPFKGKTVMMPRPRGWDDDDD